MATEGIQRMNSEDQWGRSSPEANTPKSRVSVRLEIGRFLSVCAMSFENRQRWKLIIV